MASRGAIFNVVGTSERSGFGSFCRKDPAQTKFHLSSRHHAAEKRMAALPLGRAFSESLCCRITAHLLDWKRTQGTGASRRVSWPRANRSGAAALSRFGQISGCVEKGGV